MVRAKSEPLIFEKSVPGRRAGVLPPLDVPAKPLEELIPTAEQRTSLRLPEVSELDVVRHFTRLSKRNFSVDGEFYPLGSCTMKYNPRVDENVASMPGFRQLHPLQPEETAQGALRVLYELERLLGEITGLPGVSAQPVAGAHGEFTGILVARAAHEKQGRARHKVLIPDSAHGTNPATAAMVGYEAVTIGHDRRTGELDVEDFKSKLDEDCAAIMMTVPNTLGLFERQIAEICRLAHDVGCYVYCDGANMNAMVGQVRPGDLGVDLLHINLHKTFAVPHGGGGPGGGAICVTQALEPFLPAPVVGRRADGTYFFDHNRPDTIGRVHGFYGNFNAALRSYTYILMHGKEGLPEIGANAVLNANYLLSRLKGHYTPYVDRTCMHEFVLDGRSLREHGLKTLDLAKRLIDYGYHPPTIYFPLIVPEAIMIEPTETESRETLDAFADALIAIAQEARDHPELLHDAPHETPVGRLDEVRAARQPDLRWRADTSNVDGGGPNVEGRV
ncbi:MAG TPA: aminomethyl-transferring glycine dehydrogenase subunit GcvPB [Chloroflexota bacterium]|nr:aminomethyl-transferring glycine dehydrogenase subunit GcvPB [Chloroflexota bacterium]